MNSSSLILCPTPAVGPEAQGARVKVHFLLDSLHFDFSTVGNGAFSYEPDPKLHPLNQNDQSKPYHHKPGSIISVEVSPSPFCGFCGWRESDGVLLLLRESSWIWPCSSTRWRLGSATACVW